MNIDKAPITCDINLLQDRYTMGEYQGVQNMLNLLRKESENGSEIVIIEKYTNGQTSKEEQRTQCSFSDKEKLEEWIKTKFPKL